MVGRARVLSTSRPAGSPSPARAPGAEDRRRAALEREIEALTQDRGALVLAEPRKREARLRGGGLRGSVRGRDLGADVGEIQE
jgi:hypothetical protein